MLRLASSSGWAHDDSCRVLLRRRGQPQYFSISFSLANISARANPPPWCSRDAVFEWAGRNDAKFTLDLKNGFDFDRAVFERTRELVEHYGLIERAQFIGWDHAAVRALKQANPALTTRVLLRGRPVDLVESVRASCADAVSLSYDLASRADVAALHDADIAVVVADLFEPDFARVVELGADALSWGDPIAAIRELKRLGARGK